jgi:hypothetical protein
MHVRVVRFTDVEPDRLEATLAMIQESDGPPPGVASTALRVCHDADQKTVVVLQSFDSAEDMAAAEAVLDGMPASDTPGTRASVDRCELTLELKA